MKLQRVTLARASWVGAVGGMADSIDINRGNGTGCDIEFDPGTGLVSVYKGTAPVTIIRDWVAADLAEDQGEVTDAAAGGSAGKAPKRGRPPKNPPPVQT